MYIVDVLRIEIISDQLRETILGIQARQHNRGNARVTSALVLVPDRRGKHGNHYRIPEETQQLFKDHIISIHKVTGHFYRRSSPNILYLQEIL